MPDTNSSVNALFTLTSLLSLQGASAASLIIPNVLRYLIGAAFDRYEKWTGFIISMVIALATALIATEPNPVKWLVAIVNGFLIFASAIGVNEVVARRTRGAGAAASAKKPFFHTWL